MTLDKEKILDNKSMKAFIKKILSHKILIASIVIFFIILFFNLSKVFYSCLSLYFFIGELISGRDCINFVNFFLEYWVATIYLIFFIVFFLIMILKKDTSNNKRSFIFTKRIKEEYKNNKYFRFSLLAIYTIISIGFLAPFISPHDPYKINSISFTKYLPPLSKVKYISFNEYLFDGYSYENNNDLSIKYKSKIQPKLNTFYYDSLKVVNDKIIFYQGSRIKEYSARDLNLETAQVNSTIFVLGTDSYGRDILSRIIYGTRVSLGIAFIASIVSLFLGVLLGLISGYYNRLIDSFIMRITDVFLAFPVIFLLLIIVAFWGNSFIYLAIFIGITTWMDIARLTRTQVITVKKEMYVTSLIALGFKPSRILYKHILPNIITPIIVNIIFRIGTIILMESALSFMGLGINEPIPSWGSIINNGKDNLLSAWWVSFFPGITISSVVLLFNYIGDCMRKIIKVK